VDTRGRWLRPWLSLFALSLLGVLALALQPAGGGADWFPQADKLRHAAAFAVLWSLGWRAGCAPGLALACGLLAFGMGLEVAQSFTVDREASAWDVLADAVGIAVGWYLLPRLRRVPLRS
jgi:hypothetical protein